MNPIARPTALRTVFVHRQPPNQHPLPKNVGTVAPNAEMVQLLLGGRGWTRDGDEWHEVTAGDLIWDGPGNENISRSDFENPFSCLAVGFQVSRKEGMGIRRFSRWNDLEEINRLASEVLRMMWNPEFDRSALCDYLYFRFLYQVRLYELSLKTANCPPAVAAVVERIERDYAQPLRLEDLAKESGWSVSHLHSEFRKHTRTPPHRMLMQKRLQSARARLLSSNAPIKQIAQECGFFDLPAFVHAFKAQTGQTPGAFRASHWKQNHP